MINNVNLYTINENTNQVYSNPELKSSGSSFDSFLRQRIQSISDEHGVDTSISSEQETIESETLLQGGEQLLPGTTNIATTQTGSSGLDTSKLMSTMMELMSASMSMGTMSMLNGSGSGSDGMSSMMNMMMMVLMVQMMGGDSGSDNATASASQVSDAYASAQNAGTMDEKAALYSDYIEGSANKYGVDSSLIKGIIQAESSFNNNTISSAGAQGLMQLMPGTASGLGVTDSFDPAQNIDGGTNYIAQMINRYNGDVKLALVAYNCGPGKVDKAGVTSSSDANYQNLPKAARDYADKVLAYASNYASVAA